MPVEVWTTGLSHVKVVARSAERAEREGWDGMLVVDSQNLSGDPFVGLALAARETSRLRLGTGVSNPATRHPAAAAAAIGSVHVASGGRAVFGVGRGDSALAHLGLAPAPLADLVRFVRATRAYLRGEAVPFEDLRPYERDGARPVDVLGLADTARRQSDALAAPLGSRRYRSRWSARDRRRSPRPRSTPTACWLAVGADPRAGRVGGRSRPCRGRHADRRVRQRRHPPRRGDRAPPRRRRPHDVRPVLGDGRARCAPRSTRARRRCSSRSTAPTTCTTTPRPARRRRRSSPTSSSTASASSGRRSTASTASRSWPSSASTG